VNNFAAARAARDFGWPPFVICFIPQRFSRPGGPGLLTTSRFDDFELTDRPVGRGLALNDSSRGRLLMTARLFYIAVAGSSLREAHRLPPETGAASECGVRRIRRTETAKLGGSSVQ
jgi:hypothetical protein